MRRLVLVIVGLGLFIGIVGTAGLYNLAVSAPLMPGDTLYGVQTVAQQLWGTTETARAWGEPDSSSAGIASASLGSETQTSTSSTGGTAVTNLNDPHVIPFPPGADITHSFFPLEGGHADIPCETCHQTGKYQGTA
ncbi:MAG: hypothetical protein ACE5EY_10805, partial [Anaerolineae bacterium]